MRIAQSEVEASVNKFEDESPIPGDSQRSDDLYAETAPVDSWQYEYLKRAIDFCFAVILLILFAIPGFLIAAAILLTSRGGVFYREERIGRHGRPFRIWKFRSMQVNRRWHDSGTKSQHSVLEFDRRTRKRPDDTRITRVGHFLRQWSLDELPQLLNVLRGEMSLVGPRPIVASEMALYGTRLKFYLKAVPGLSGLWQVSGRSLVGYERRTSLDAIYVKSWSMGTDFYILLRTVPAVLGKIGAY